ncbi:Occludin/ELL family protein [Vulcanococcus limneticus]|uniref:Occludin/ELL family protein n=1 Tax=Vulcanococcus limneticus TaxID=2170428 RepID=UPI00398C0B04
MPRTFGLPSGLPSGLPGGLPMASALAAAACVGSLCLAQPPSAEAGPVVCTTTLEAPLAGSGPAGMNAFGPVEVTRCGPVTTTPEMVEQRFYSYTAPFARGVDITHQITDILGIAMGGGDGTRVVGLGFPDQTIVWDGSALHNTYQALLDRQSNPLPWRTDDVNNGFCSGLPQGSCAVPVTQQPQPRITYRTPVRGLW